jgi:amino acid adenylation domain-containing protein
MDNPLPNAKCPVHIAVAERALEAPDAIAAVGPQGCLSYAELDRRSDALSRRLRGWGVGPEVPVGVCSGRSTSVAAALLGILRAGGAYVPLDPGYPAKRLAFMAEDAGVTIVLVQPGIRVSLTPGVRTIELDPALFESAGDDVPPCSIDPDNLAYIMYTSGSTGDPKGVMVSHAAMMNTLGWLQDEFQLSAEDVVAHKTSISFTDSIWELLWPPLAGSRMVVVEEAVAQFPRRLLQQLRQLGVTVTQFVPAQMRLFLDEVNRGGDPDPVPSLRWVFNGGEALPPALAQDWYRAFPRTRIANAYGMTESAIYGTNWVVEPAPGEPTILVGRPIANERAYVLDGFYRPCPSPCVGEIHLAGSSLARGYLGRPDLTAERFVPDPSGPAGSRMYRTGDLGRHVAGGEIACLGRLDRQVKIRGARVELGEVEAALAQYPELRQAVVVARRRAEDNQMIAYYTFRAADPGARELYRFLAGKLPDYMIPTFLVPLEAFPLTPNGKVDRQRLKEPD